MTNIDKRKEFEKYLKFFRESKENVSIEDVFVFINELPKNCTKEQIIKGLEHLALKEVDYPDDIVLQPSNIKPNHELREYYQLINN